MYIVRRTQLYLDDQMWRALHARARREKTTISELVRRAVRDRYPGDFEKRRAAMQAFTGVRKAATGHADSVGEVRALRRGSRIERLAGQ